MYKSIANAIVHHVFTSVYTVQYVFYKKWQGYIGKPPVKNYQEDVQVPLRVYANYFYDTLYFQEFYHQLVLQTLSVYG